MPRGNTTNLATESKKKSGGLEGRDIRETEPRVDLWVYEIKTCGCFVLTAYLSVLPPFIFLLVDQVSITSMKLLEGSNFPAEILFQYVPLQNGGDPLSCELPRSLDVDALLQGLHPGKFLLIVQVPGAFTPTCTANHVPPFLQEVASLAAKGIAAIVVVSAANDAFVMHAWGTLLSGGTPVHEIPLYFANDPIGRFGKSYGLAQDAGPMGVRSARCAIVIAKSGEIVYCGRESERVVTSSGVEAVLAKL